MVEIAKCRMCGGNPRAKIVRKEAVRPYYLSCTNLDCGVDGPMRPTPAEAIAAWEELMAPAAPEPAAGTVRVPVQVAYAASSMGSWPFVLASDGTMWGMPNGMSEKGVWSPIPPLPQPVEIPGTVESGS